MSVILEKEVAELMQQLADLRKSLDKLDKTIAEFRAAKASLKEVVERAKK